MLTMQIENMKQDKSMVDATCDTNDLMQVVDTDATKDMIDDSLTGYEMESFINNELMKTSFVEDESQAEDVKAQSDTKRSISECELEFSFEVTKENIHC
jgi:hypothetical protein